MSQANVFRVAVVQWTDDNGMARMIRYELRALGHIPLYLYGTSVIPSEVDVVFSYGPYGKFLPILASLSDIPIQHRPTFVHWNTEGIPDLRIPWSLMHAIGAFRSWLGRLEDSERRWIRVQTQKSPLGWVNARMLRFRYVGDYYYAHRKGWIDLFSDSSAIYAQFHTQHGLPTLFAPWGATPEDYADLGLERDIDVLWMGKRATQRRSNRLNRIRRELARHGVQMYVADGVENPFIFGEERMHFLNRTKITLNLTRTWYDDNFSRFSMAAPNRSLFVSEPLLPHCPPCKAGIHYVSAPIEKLVETILYYLKHDGERLRITEQAYQLFTTQLTFRNSIKTMMDAVEKVRQQASPVTTSSQNENALLSAVTGQISNVSTTQPMVIYEDPNDCS